MTIVFFVENYFSDDEDNNISNNSVSRTRSRARASRLDSNDSVRASDSTVSTTVRSRSSSPGPNSSVIPSSLRFSALNARPDTAASRGSTARPSASESVRLDDDSDSSNVCDVSSASVFSAIRCDNDRVWPYDPETSTIDLRYLRSTDLPFNSFVHMPPPLQEDEEIKFQNLKRDLVSVADRYVSETKAKARSESGTNIKYANLSESEVKGLESIQKRDDVVIFQTDKSGRMAIDSKQNYVAAAEVHIAGDSTIDDKIQGVSH